MTSTDMFDAATTIAEALAGLTDVECIRAVQMALVSVGKPCSMITSDPETPAPRTRGGVDQYGDINSAELESKYFTTDGEESSHG